MCTRKGTGRCRFLGVHCCACAAPTLQLQTDPFKSGGHRPFVGGEGQGAGCCGCFARTPPRAPSSWGQIPPRLVSTQMLRARGKAAP